MPPKKKASEAPAPSASNPPPPQQTAGGEDAGVRTGVDEGAHGLTKSKDKTALPFGGVAGSHDDRASVDAPRPSQEAQDRQHRGTHGTIRSLDPNRAGGSRDAQGQHARQRAGATEARSPRRNTAPSNIVGSPSISRSSSRSFGTSSTTPRLPSNARQDRRLEGHHSESHRLRQRRHSTTGDHIASAAGQPSASQWR